MGFGHSVGLSDEPRPCRRCGELRHVELLYELCEDCNRDRERAYDDYVDPWHCYHQHNPDRTVES